MDGPWALACASVFISLRTASSGLAFVSQVSARAVMVNCDSASSVVSSGVRPKYSSISPMVRKRGCGAEWALVVELTTWGALCLGRVPVINASV